MRGLHSLTDPTAKKRLHVISTQTERHFPPKAVSFDCRKISQTSGGKSVKFNYNLLRGGFDTGAELFLSQLGS